jgi:hypothetical protein
MFLSKHQRIGCPGEFKLLALPQTCLAAIPAHLAGEDKRNLAAACRDMARLVFAPKGKQLTTLIVADAALWEGIRQVCMFIPSTQ